jgi:dihydrofolate reductase
MIKMIAAVSENMVIGKNNTLPWQNSYPEDLKHFREMTVGSTIIMGRNTFESLGRPLPKRRNLVVTRGQIDNVECFPSLQSAIFEAGNNPVYNDIWLIGGSSIYSEGMEHAHEIHLTRIPEWINPEAAVIFPIITSRFIKNDTVEIGNNLFKDVYKSY